MKKSDYQQAWQIIDSCSSILIVQADNPDGDSLGSSLALESLISQAGKNVSLYCGTFIPDYLKYMSGWSRVDNKLPAEFDLVVLVDVSTNNLLDNITNDTRYKKYLSSNKLVFDHHKTVSDEIASILTINDSDSSSTGEIIFGLAKTNDLQISIETGEYIVSAILSDTQGLTNQSTSSQTYRVVAELVELGVDRPQLEDRRRQFSKMTQEIFKFKSSLIAKTEFYINGRLAIVHVDQQEIKKYSPLYNPAALILPDLQQVENVDIAVVMKTYDDGRVTGAIRSSNTVPLAAKLAEQLGGGGHDYASGFKQENGKTQEEVKQFIIAETEMLLGKI